MRQTSDEAANDNAPRDSRLYAIARHTIRFIATLGFDLKAWGVANVPRRGGVLIVSNHQSYLDPPLVGTPIPRQLSFLAKAPLFENERFGRLIRSVNAFPVRQGEGDIGAVRESIARLKAGHALLLFPEGSRTTTGELLPVQPGVSLIVRRAGVPVVPAVIDGTYQAWPPSRKWPRLHPVRILYGPPLHAERLKGKNVAHLIEETFARMMVELREKDRRLH